MKHLFWRVAMLSGLAACAAPPAPPPTPAQMTAMEFEARANANTTDRPLDTVVQINTATVTDALDKTYLRAFIDKKSGATVYQLVSSFYYAGPKRVYWSANYETPQGPQQVPVKEILRVRDCSHQVFRSCAYSQAIAVDIDERLFRIIAGRYQEGGSAVWNYRINEKLGFDDDSYVTAAEFEGLLLAVEAAQRKIRYATHPEEVPQDLPPVRQVP